MHEKPNEPRALSAPATNSPKFMTLGNVVKEHVGGIVPVIWTEAVSLVALTLCVATNKGLNAAIAIAANARVRADFRI